MLTNKVSSICVYEDTDIKALITNACKSETDVCIISGNAEQDAVDKVTLALKEQDKTVMADSQYADIMYLTGEMDDYKTPCVFRFVIKNTEELKQHCLFFEKVLRATQSAFMLLRCAMDVNAFIYACDSLIGISMLGKVALIGVPVCLSSRYRLTAKDVLDIKDVVTDHAVMQKPMAFIKQYRKSSAYCLDCSSRSECFGVMKEGAFSTFYPGKHKASYESIYDLVCEMYPLKKVRTGILEFEPRHSEDYTIGLETLKAMQQCRLNGNFNGPDFFYIWDFKESCFFNRPLEEKEIFTEDPRGLMGMNWRFIGKGIKELEWKHKCDLLLPEHGFNTTVKIKFDSSWKPEKQKTLDDLTFSTIIRVVEEHGGKGHIQQIGNDLLYNGKKFAGKEWLFLQDIGYIENTVVTCEYEPEKIWFKKLYHHPGERQITGITEELPSVTKEMLMTEINKEIMALI